MLRFNTCCRFCSVSLLWCAKENECNDSDGNRVRSSPNGIAGDAGAAARESEALREFAAEEEADRKSKAGRFGSEGSRAVLMRRKPVSRSAVRMGDLFVADMHVSYCLMQARCRQSCEVPTLACLPFIARASRRVTGLQCLILHFIRTGSSHSRCSSPRSFALVATGHPLYCWSRCWRWRQGCQTICVWESAGLGWLCGRLLFQYPGSRGSARWVRARQKRRRRQSWGLQTTQKDSLLARVTTGSDLTMDSTWA